MEQEKRGHGRPKIDTHITEYGAPSRRQAINAMYMFEGVHLLSVAATDIPDSDLLWHSDDATQTAKSKNGILEQLGRMLVKTITKRKIAYISPTLRWTIHTSLTSSTTMSQG